MGVTEASARVGLKPTQTVASRSPSPLGAMNPGGSTVPKEGDRLTVIGDPTGLEDFAHRFIRRRPGPDSNS